VIDHVSVGVADLEGSKAFYEGALAPLGYSVLLEYPGVCGFGAEQKPDLWISERERSGPVHIALASPDRETVDAFHEAALGAGGIDNGPPGPRPHYHEHYYAAYVLDPDGNNLEAVCHRPE
jgi:catechol 2,3-dioxygenase-like lactoylglutathione lyase family enzyme